MIFYHYVAKLLLKKISHVTEKQLEQVHLIFKNFEYEILKVYNRHRFGSDEVLHRERMERLPSNKRQINILVDLK